MYEKKSLLKRWGREEEEEEENKGFHLSPIDNLPLLVQKANQTKQQTIDYFFSTFRIGEDIEEEEEEGMPHRHTRTQ